MSDLGKTLIVVGLAFVIVGLVLWSGFGRNWLGRLPGDIHLRRGNAQFYFPVVTCLLISLALSLLSWLLRGRR